MHHHSSWPIISERSVIIRASELSTQQGRANPAASDGLVPGSINEWLNTVDGAPIHLPDGKNASSALNRLLMSTFSTASLHQQNRYRHHDHRAVFNDRDRRHGQIEYSTKTRALDSLLFSYGGSNPISPIDITMAAAAFAAKSYVPVTKRVEEPIWFVGMAAHCYAACPSVLFLVRLGDSGCILRLRV